MVQLPEFPWDTLAGAKARAAEHPGGLVDLSVGSPVDPTPALLQDALREATDPTLSRGRDPLHPPRGAIRHVPEVVA